MTKIKICGISNLSDARFCVRCGADFLGFVFYKKSPRFVSPQKARKIIKKIKQKVIKVGVFVNEKPQTVKKIARLCGLDFLQLHGDESEAYVRKLRGFGIIKAFRIKERLDTKLLESYPEALFLFDSFKKNIFGGTGQVFDWALLEALSKTKKPFIVSGGLTPDNVRGLLERIRPFAVDVSSGVEKAPGKKDLKLVKKFIERVKKYNSRHTNKKNKQR